jgi:HD-like signal output (HDOD) protein
MSEIATVKEDTWKTVQMDVLDRIEKLPSLSVVVTEFLEMARQDIFTARDFEKILTKDQALVARLLKIANSGMFSGSRSVKSIPEALVLIGMENMKKIVYAVSSEGLLRQELKCYHYPEKGFWMHSMGCGTLCRAVAETSQQSSLNGDEAFVAGLIHDVGKLIIDDFLDRSAGTREVTLPEEVKACGLDHAELAAHIMKVWKIPEPIQEAVRHHHTPRVGDEWHSGAVVVHLADTIANTWRIGKQSLMSLGEDIDTAPLAEPMAAIGLPEEKVPQMLMDVRQNLARLQDLYDDDDLD